MITDRQSLRAELRERVPRGRDQLLPALHFLQHEFGYLPDWAMEVVGWHLGVPASEVYGAATSYTELRIERPADHVLRVCTGLSCRAGGANELLTAARSEIGTNPGPNADGTVAVVAEETPCGFLCGVGPAVELDGRWHGRATRESLTQLIRGIDGQ